MIKIRFLTDGCELVEVSDTNDNHIATLIADRIEKGGYMSIWLPNGKRLIARRSKAGRLNAKVL